MGTTTPCAGMAENARHRRDENFAAGPERLYRLALPDTSPRAETDEIQARHMQYYRNLADAPQPSVAVVEKVDVPHYISAYWGEINTTVQIGFDITGSLTNGVMHDLDDLREGFLVVAGSIGPSHGFVHVRKLDTTVEIFGMCVGSDHMIHADCGAALFIRLDVIDALEVLSYHCKKQINRFWKPHAKIILLLEKCGERLKNQELEGNSVSDTQRPANKRVR
ncbi:hypothetical protein OS189_16305 [Sulfitobacter sp. F26169L]|uniref:RraA family protein n=1 Tax=Sulfitobacter sp. F26169L TaxID=2996015 RepID=UPI002260BFCA|nr:hypothetical protein [Sulfitobacter sp. F26169L]MCX7567907.1 hypothetical protein [Sulfitobacter sp. F26169L]